MEGKFRGRKGKCTSDWLNAFGSYSTRLIASIVTALSMNSVAGLIEFLFILMVRIRSGVIDDRLEYLMKQLLVVPQCLQPTLASRPSSENKLCISRPEGHSNTVYQISASKTIKHRQWI